MQFYWTNHQEEPILLKTFLKNQGISKRLLAKIKFSGGCLQVNGIEKTVRHLLESGDQVTVYMPGEGQQDNVLASDLPFEILYEDEHFLVVNKEAGIASIPSFVHPSYSMANRVKGYYQKQGYENQVIHVVTRLDRDTSGVMLFAKHQFAHAHLDTQLRAGQVEKLYVALAPQGQLADQHGYINAPIGRCPDSIMVRQVAQDGAGKAALTEYWKLADYACANLYRIKLHTGRTHQIRVHFTHMGSPLIGDSLYGGLMATSLQRQALHCESLTFTHPFKQEKMTFLAPLPQDMQQWIESEQENGRN